MTIEDDRMVDAIWRASDLTRAYLGRDSAQVTGCIAGLDTGRLERVLVWLVLDHDRLFDDLGGPSMSVREIDEAAALAPVEIELATTTALRRVASGETGLTHAVEALALLPQIHTVAVCIAVMLLETYGRAHALELITAESMLYERMGHPKPY